LSRVTEIWWRCLTTFAYRIGYSGALSLDSLWFGSTLAPGRWHTNLSGFAQPVVYASASRALSQLEKRVNANGVAPVKQALIKLELAKGCKCLSAITHLMLKDDWKNDLAYTQDVGTAWLKSKSSLALWVPAYVEPLENNLLINPMHPQYQSHVKITVERNPFVFDPRMF
jgi:RES domain-containing protein